MSNDYDFIATGHYAITDNQSLYKGIDNSKDQSYFLHAIDKEVLQKTIFPLGELKKEKVRQIAKENSLITSNKKDSTGICFIGERPFPEFVGSYLSGEEGNIINENDDVIGIHQGLVFYTLGQRQGLGIGGVKGSPDLPWYVAKKNLKTNELLCVQGNDHPLLFSRELSTKNLFKLEDSLPTSFEGTAKVRYRQEDQGCEIYVEDNALNIKFHKPQRSVTPGQSVVIYKNDKCLGGGEICTIN
jgi:tRNA-specific 2-thiouridylase